jgi:coenzyme PQQ precursor peptide PqqA
MHPWQLHAFTIFALSADVHCDGGCKRDKAEKPMAWTTPVLVEICVGLEINGYLPAEF